MENDPQASRAPTTDVAREEAIFNGAKVLSPVGRAAYLLAACGQDVRQQQGLLREQAEKGLAIERKMREMSSIGSKLTTAGFMLSQGLFDKAEEVMKDVPPIFPQSATIYYVIGDQHGRRAQWQQAITNFARSIEVDATNHLGYQYLASLFVQTGNQAAYEDIRERILHDFGKAADPAIAERMAKACLILPPPAADLDVLGKMADIAVGAGPKADHWPDFEFVKGLAEFRLGHYNTAIEWLRKVITPDGEPARSAEAYAVTAMAQYKQAQTDAARGTLASARNFAAKNLENYAGPNWHDRIIGLALLREAAALIESNAPPDGLK